MTVAERIRAARVAMGWTVPELAKACGVSESAIQMYECGQRVPRDSIKKIMAQQLNTPVQDLFF